MKTCICCGVEKDKTEFHSHKAMKDGLINKCKNCVLAYIKEWRVRNPEVRKEEHARKQVKNGRGTRQEYFERLKSKAIGRRASSLKYSRKRRTLVRQPLTELDSFVLEEAAKLADKREKMTGIKWHVDHIIPLMLKQACGLHNAFNIQVVPASWNVRKGNRSMSVFFPY